MGIDIDDRVNNGHKDMSVSKFWFKYWNKSELWALIIPWTVSENYGPYETKLIHEAVDWFKKKIKSNREFEQNTIWIEIIPRWTLK